MNVLYTSNDNYAMLLGISLTSLYISNVNVNQINVYIVDDGIGDENKEKLLKTAKKYNRELFFIEMPQMYELLGCRPDTLKWGDNIFCRLYIPTLFSEKLTIEKILYLDCDTIICSSLTDLWNCDLEGRFCAAGLECMGNLHKKLIGLKREDVYVNSGVLLIDVKAWREHGIEQICTDFLHNHLRKLEYPDEGILNGTLKGKIKVLAPEYNLTSLKCTFTYQELKLYRRSAIMYEKEEYIKALKHPVIIHYTSCFMIRRPWIYGERDHHFFEKEFLKMQSSSEWRDMPLIRQKEPVLRIIVRRGAAIWRLPVIFLCGIIYSYIKPLIKAGSR